ncbi:PRC-barrel domain-containing protein [Candidatus Poribacteria bacterium]|nr:PRC-barrel domain-containing protein [Candidatus Poribacteria bacterium]
MSWKTISVLIGVAFAASLFVSAQVLGGELYGTSKTGEKAAMHGMCKASALFGKAVKSDKGDEYGKIEEVLFGEDGRITYLVFSSGGTLETGKLIPIPWAAAKSGMKKDALYFSMDKSFFDKAPSFAKDEWKKFEDAEWTKKVHSYYESGTYTEGKKGEEKPMHEHWGEHKY